MARSKSRLVNLNAPSPKQKRASKVTNRIFPKVFVWLLAAIVFAGAGREDFTRS